MNIIAKYFQPFRLLVFFVFMCSNCSSDKKEPEYPNPFRDNIIGRWKMIEVGVSINYSPRDTTDYSKENIIFDFQENNKLVITGPIPDVLVVFDHFQEGVHFYEYSKLNVCPRCSPGMNLIIDEPELGRDRGAYFCSALLDTETMSIGITGQLIGGEFDDAGYLTGFDVYNWGINFLKMN